MIQKKTQATGYRGNKDSSKNIEKKTNVATKHVAKLRKVEPIKKIVWPEPVCEKCGQVIKDMTLAISDKHTGNPVHFECVLQFLKNSEELKEGEELLYIGNGNFAILWFEDPKIRKHFKIRKLIEWEEKNSESEWRIEMAKLGSSV